jgi:hypothetical protein
MHRFPLRIQEISHEGDEEFLSERVFQTKDEFKASLWDQFKTPGRYNLRNTDRWRRQAATHERYNFFTENVKHSRNWEKYWKTEKEKCIQGIIIDGFYIPGFYYFYLNFLKIFNKVERSLTYPTVWDSDYHFFLYICLCIVEGKHAVVVKTRQRGYSYKIAAVLYWSYIFGNASINTIGASDISYVTKTWEYIDEYRSFVNTQTAWRRGPQVPKALDWIERTLTDEGEYYGNKSKLKGVTFQQSPTKGVGGAQSFFFYEEAGIAPTLLKTIGYIKPAIEEGNITTGTIIISGSVGELDDCQDLKKVFEDPEAYNFLSVPNIFEENPENARCGFFVPDSWSLAGFIDAEGNSKLEESIQFIKHRRELSQQGSKAREQYQLELSQKPLTPAEAFCI